LPLSSPVLIQAPLADLPRFAVRLDIWAWTDKTARCKGPELIEGFEWWVEKRFHSGRRGV